MRRQLVVLPTGTGKTVVFCHLAKVMAARTLILVHRDELLQQAIEKIRMVWPEAVVGVVKGRQNQLDAGAIAASVQTLVRKDRRAQLPPFELVIVDEAHHYVAHQYREVLGDLGAWREDGPLVVGFTATPQRGDKVGLQRVFQKVAFHRSILSMIRQGYLCDLKGIQVRAEFDLDDVKTVAGDYDEQDLARVVNQPWFNDLVVDAYRKHAEGRQAIAFACSVDHATELAGRFMSAGIAAGVVHGRLNGRERHAILESFRKQDIQVLSNCELLTEGFDAPEVSAVLLARPTKSQALYTQMVGRGIRLFPGKAECMVLDFVGNSQHGLMSLPALFGLKAKDLASKGGSVEKAAATADRTDDSGRTVAVAGTSISDWTSEAVDLFNRSRLRWLPVDDGAMVLLGGEAGNVFLVQVERGWRAVTTSRAGQRRDLAGQPLQIGYAQGVAEDWIRQQGKVGLTNRSASWRSKPMSQGQEEVAQRYGIAVSPDMTQGEASDLMTIHFARWELHKIRTGRQQQRSG